MDRKSQRRMFRGGLVPTPAKYNIDPFPWQGGIDYDEFADAPESFKWWMACLGFVRIVCVSNPLSESDEAVVTEILTDWFEHNPQENPKNSRAWDAHAVALRTEVLVTAAERVSDDTWLRPHLREHLEFLAAEENYAGNWNHGVDQDKALISVGRYLDDEEAARLGLKRLEVSILSTVDDEGVTVEQAVHYHHFNFVQIQKYLPFLGDGELSDAIKARLNARLEAMPTFLAHATRPDGTWFEIGDTPHQPAKSILRTVAEYAATAGESGPKPQELFKSYTNGYAFGRSGWGDDRPFNEESAYSLRFGQPRQIHGHLDHLSIRFVTGGVEMIKDGGFHGYTDDDNRMWLRSPSAHSTFIAHTRRKKSTGHPSTLTYEDCSADWRSYTMTANPVEGTYLTRSVSFEFGPDIMVVWDRVQSEGQTEIEQRWLLPGETRLDATGQLIRGDGPVAFNAVNLIPTSSMTVINADQEGAPLGATETMYEMAPNASIQYMDHGPDGEFVTVFKFGVGTNDSTPALLKRGPLWNRNTRVITGASRLGKLLLDPERGIVLKR
ncbi:MAG: heparinase II/III domain-containing protein [Gulosibacter sp.]|uniref:heparinase II/III domain-containing protein n=1 Tax=Gulosibacter sp. TaxID=2817531 RepID=UPI003F92DAE2